MGNNTEKPPEKLDYDISIIRPEMQVDDVSLRGRGMAPERLRDIKKGLLTLHTAELMAVNIYKFQITREPSEFNQHLITAMCNEMTHLQDFQVKLYEYGWKPSKLRWINWLVSATFAYISRLRGKKAILNTGIRVERKAVTHYEEFLKTIDWDEDTRKIIEKDQADEYGHISRWEALLKTL